MLAVPGQVRGAWLVEDNFESTTDTYGRDNANGSAWNAPVISGTGSIAIGTALARPLYGEGQYLNFSAPVSTDRASIKKVFATPITDDFYARFYISLAAGHGIDALNENIRCYSFASSGAASVGNVGFEYDNSALRIKATVGVYGSVTGTYDFQDAGNSVFTPAVVEDTWYEVRLSMRFSEGDYGKLYVSVYAPNGATLMDAVFTAGAAQPTDIADATVGISYATATPTGTIGMDRVAFRTGEMPFYQVSKAILAPNGNGTTSWALSSGTSSSTLTSDQSDSTYIYTDQASKYHTVNFAPPTAVTDKLVCGIRMWHRIGAYGSNCRMQRKVGLNTSSTTNTGPNSNTEFSDDITNYPLLAIVDGTGAEWTWANLAGLLGVVNSSAETIGGGKLTEMWAEVFFGDSADYPFPSHIIFGGVSDTQIKVGVRMKDRPAQEVKLRYGTVAADVKSNTGDTLETAGQVVSSGNDYSVIFTVASLTADTRYYFDIIFDGNQWSALSETTGLRADPVWGSTLPSCKTAIATVAENFRFALIGDDQVPQIEGKNWEKSLASKSPDFVVHAGDIQTLHTTVEAEYREGFLRLFDPDGGFAEFFQSVSSNTPIFYTYSDHDYGGDNTNKVGSDSATPTMHPGYMYLDAVTDYLPLPTLANDGDTYGTATGGDTNTLINTGVDFTTLGIYPGQVVWNVTDTGYCVVESVAATSVECSAALSAGSFDAGDSYAIGSGGLWYKFIWGPAEFFVIDTRHKRDLNDLDGADMLDGMRWLSGAGGDDGDGSAAGHEQRDWLIAQINASTAQWKFVVCQIPFKYDELNTDKWAQYDPNDKQFDYLRTQITADNVVWLAADRHFAAIDDASAAADPWPNILPGPMYNGAFHQALGSYEWLGTDTVVDGDNNPDSKTSFAILDVTSYSVTVSIYDSDGELLSSNLVGKLGAYRGSVDDPNRLYFNAAAADGGKGMRSLPYNVFSAFPFSGYNIPAGAEIFISGAMGTLDISGLADTGAKTVKIWPGKSGSITGGLITGPNDVIDLSGGASAGVFSSPF